MTRPSELLPDDYVWTPDVADHDPERIKTAVFQALGSASTCWEHLEEAGVFDSDLARKIGDGLMKFLKAEGVPVDP